MAVPRNRLSNARKNKRRAHLAHRPKNFVSCRNCGKPKLPHCICESCGGYKGTVVLQKKEKAVSE